MTALLIPFALKDGRIVHVDSVAGGRACGCTCPACEGALIARKGRIRVHHFAHDVGNVCDGESALHATAKLLLFQRIQDALKEQDNIPDLPMVWHCRICPNGCQHQGNLLKGTSHAAMEQTIPGANIRPDILLTNVDDIPTAFLEIVHTHAPDENVIRYAENNKIPILEFCIETPNDLAQINEKPLHPQTAHIAGCPCLICRRCQERVCERDRHRHCEHCGQLYEPGYGPKDGHYFCDKCQKCVNAPSDFGIYHWHCRDCGTICSGRSDRYVRCYCCYNERKFGVKCSARNRPDHRHCWGCGQVFNHKGIYEYCYPCSISNQAKAWQEWENAQREQERLKEIKREADSQLWASLQRDLDESIARRQRLEEH